MKELLPPPTHRETFRVRYRETDRNGILKLSSWFDFLQEAAANHAARPGKWRIQRWSSRPGFRSKNRDRVDETRRRRMKTTEKKRQPLYRTSLGEMKSCLQ